MITEKRSSKLRRTRSCTKSAYFVDAWKPALPRDCGPIKPQRPRGNTLAFFDPLLFMIPSSTKSVCVQSERLITKARIYARIPSHICPRHMLVQRTLTCSSLKEVRPSRKPSSFAQYFVSVNAVGRAPCRPSKLCYAFGTLASHTRRAITMEVPSP
jgi:hypothetical protein